MAKYSEKLVGKMVALIEEDAYTITEICRILNVDRKTFYIWKNTKSDFREAIDAATDNREEKLRMMARQAMKKKLSGYKMVETKTVYAVDKDSEDGTQLSVKEYVVKDKYCVPETSAIAFALAEGGGKGMKKRGTPHFDMSPLHVVVSSEEAKRNLETLADDLMSGRR